MDLRCQRCMTTRIGHNHSEDGLIIEIFCVTCGYTYLYYNGKEFESSLERMDRLKRVNTCRECGNTFIDFGRSEIMVRTICNSCEVKLDTQTRKRSEEKKRLEALNGCLSEDEETEET